MPPRQVRVHHAGFARVPYWLLDKIQGSKGTVLLVYCSLCYFSDYETGITAAGWREVREQTGLGRSTVLRDIALLRELGAVVEMENGDLWLPADGPVDGSNPDILWTISDSNPSNLWTNRPATGTPPSRYWDGTPQNPEPIPYLFKSISEDAVSDGAPFTEQQTGDSTNDEQSNATEDPWKEPANRVTKIAFSQAIRPSSKFVAVQSLVKQLLQAGWPESHIIAAIEAGVIPTWTRGAVEIALRKIPLAADEPEVPFSGEDSEVAAVFDDWDDQGFWMDSDGAERDEPPEIHGLERPRHPDGGFRDRFGNQYRLDFNTGERTTT